MRRRRFRSHDPTETSAAQDFRSAKALFVPSLNAWYHPFYRHAQDLRREESQGHPHEIPIVMAQALSVGMLNLSAPGTASIPPPTSRFDRLPHEAQRTRRVDHK